MTGFEPATPSSQARCATKLRYIPKSWFNAICAISEGFNSANNNCLFNFQIANQICNFEFINNKCYSQEITYCTVVYIFLTTFIKCQPNLVFTGSETPPIGVANAAFSNSGTICPLTKYPK